MGSVRLVEPVTLSKVDGSFSTRAPTLVTALPMFVGNPPGPSFGQLRQQRITNCPLVAIMAALAHASPKRVMAMVRVRTVTEGEQVESWYQDHVDEKGERVPVPVPKAGVFAVEKVITVRFQKQSIDISPMLYLDGKRKPRFAFSKDGSGWMSYIEKAYVVYRAQGLYENLEFKGIFNPLTVERVMEDLVHEFDQIAIADRGGILLRDPEPVNTNPQRLPSQAIDGRFEQQGPDTFGTTDHASLNAARLRSTIKARLQHAGTRATIATTPSSGNLHGLTGNHTFAVTSFGKDRVQLFDAIAGAVKVLSLDDFIEAVGALYQAR
jgi:hypothetical protein